MEQKEPNYWVVGAMLGGQNPGDIFDECIERGYWYCWDPKEKIDEESSDIKEMREKLLSIEAGDRIAIKKQLGTGDNARFIEIRAIGIVKVRDENEWRVYVDWLLPAGKGKAEIGRRVPKKGPGGIKSISGPFKNDEANKDWLPNIFSI